MHTTLKHLSRRLDDVTPRRRIAATAIVVVSLTTAFAGAPPPAGAASRALHDDVAPQLLAALDGTVVQAAGTGPKYTLMQRNPDGSIVPVAGAPTAIYRAIDLGHDAGGELVLTYIRCTDTAHCRAFSDDLAGHRVTFKRLTPKRCTLSTAPARWNSRVAYGLACSRLHGRPNVFDPTRSGLFARTGAGAPRRLRMPRRNRSFVNRVDLRGRVVGAVTPGNESFAFTQTVKAGNLRAMQITDNQGETDDYQTMGMSLGKGGRLWTMVVESQEEGRDISEPISRLDRSGCIEEQRLSVPVDPNTHTSSIPASAIAADGGRLLLATPAGVVAHAFAPASPCS